MRIIDADELKKMFPDKGEGAWTYNITAKAYIDAQPTIDQWHYPSRGEYPTENGEYWVAWRSLRTGQLMYGVGLWELDRFWLNPQPKAWQYIVPPKEEA